MKRWYADGVRFGCTEGGDCCHNHGEYDSVYFTRKEAKAVARQLDVSEAELMASYLKMDDGYLVARSRKGACVFLDGCRCSVYASRPVPCRTWPFWPETMTRSTWNREVVPFCRGVGRGRLHDSATIEAAVAAKAKHDATLDDERDSGLPLDGDGGDNR